MQWFASQRAASAKKRCSQPARGSPAERCAGRLAWTDATRWLGAFDGGAAECTGDAPGSMRSEKIGGKVAAVGGAVDAEGATTMLSPGDSVVLAGTVVGAALDTAGDAVAGTVDAADAMPGAGERAGPKLIHAVSASTMAPRPNTARTSPRGAFASAAVLPSDAAAVRCSALAAAADAPCA